MTTIEAINEFCDSALAYIDNNVKDLRLRDELMQEMKSIYYGIKEEIKD